MIPKIIHFSWFSGDPYPESVKRCMDTWHKLLPEYELILWDRERIREIDSPFMTEALLARKWAFASDVVRCYAVYTYGGIWMDTDVEVLQSFDPYLVQRFFIGKEAASFFNVADTFSHIYALGAHCFGAEKGHPFLLRCCEYYQNRHFCTSDDLSLPMSLRYDMRILPEIMAIIAKKEFGYRGSLDSEEMVETADEGMCIYPYSWFDTPRYHSSKEVVAIHYLHGGWVNDSSVTPAIRGFRKKDWKYYMYRMLNKVLKPWRLKVNLLSY